MKNNCLKLKILPVETTSPDTIAYRSLDLSKPLIQSPTLNYKWNRYLLSPKIIRPPTCKFVKFARSAADRTPPTATMTRGSSACIRDATAVTMDDEANASSPIDHVRISFPMSPQMHTRKALGESFIFQKTMFNLKSQSPQNDRILPKKINIVKEIVGPPLPI